MDRRDVLLAVSAVAAAAAAAAVQPALGDEDHSHQTHRAQMYPALASAAADCVRTGEICVDHCLALFAQGDKSTAACARSVTQLTSICGTCSYWRRRIPSSFQGMRSSRAKSARIVRMNAESTRRNTSSARTARMPALPAKKSATKSRLEGTCHRNDRGAADPARSTARSKRYPWRV